MARFLLDENLSPLLADFLIKIQPTHFLLIATEFKIRIIHKFAK